MGIPTTRLGLALLVLAGGAGRTVAQQAPPGFERLHSAGGLSHNSVYAIAQDRAGFMWFGTLDGLNRYDGYAFTVYRHAHGDTTSLPNNLVREIHEDRRGRLWVGTEEGIARFDRRRDRFVRYAVPADRLGRRAAFALREDAAGTLWAGTAGGLLRYVEAEGRFRRVSGWPAGQVVSDLQLDRRGRLWALVTAAAEEPGLPGASVLVRLDRAGRVAERLAVAPAWGGVHRFAFDARGRVWLNARGPGVRAGSALRPTHPERSDSAYELVRDARGALWMGTADGRGVCVASDEAVGCHVLDPENTTWLHSYVRSVFLDRSGALWVGTYSGVYRRDPHRKPFRLLRHDPDEPGTLSASAVSSVVRGADGVLWVGTFGGGVNRMDGEAVRVYRAARTDPHGLPDDVVWHLLRDRRGTVWAATGLGLARYDPAADRFRRYPLPPPPGGDPDEIGTTYLVEDADGGLWVGSFQGLFHLDPATGRARYYAATGDPTGLAQADVTVLLLQGRQTLWIAGGQGRLSRLDLPTGRFTHYVPRTADGAPLPSEAAYDLHRTADGMLWLATGAGLHRFDPAAETFRPYTVRDGLPGAVVYSIAEDGRGALWLGTNRGLARFTPPDGAVRPYDLADGIGTMEFNRHARFRDADGTLYVGGVDGLTVFHPDAIRDNPFVPPVVLTRVETASRDGATTLDLTGRDAVTLTHREASVSFEFAALSYTDPFKNRYAYRLEGFDGGWVEAGTQRVARYTNLPAGRYTFRVRAANNDGVWNRRGAALAVTVLPPYWQTAWFRLLMLAAAAALLTVAYRVRVRRLLEVERLRLRIAGDLHDDLSTDLTGIALVTGLLLRRPALPDADRRQLAEVRDTALHMVEGLRDIVWTINPEHDTLDAMVRRMRDTAARLLSDVEHTFEAHLPDADHAVAMTLRRDVLLVYKEALHNVARHAGASHVAIRLDQRDGRLDLVVEDDGRGFDPAQAAAGHGLRSMRARAALLGAELDVASRPGAGTRLHLGLRVA